MLDISYRDYDFALVIKQLEFFRETGLVEIVKIKSMVAQIRTIFKLPAKSVRIYVAQGHRVYKLEVLGDKEIPFAVFVYLPEQQRVDLYDLMTPDTPILQWKNKKAVTKNISPLLAMSGIEKVFGPIILVS